MLPERENTAQFSHIRKSKHASVQTSILSGSVFFNLMVLHLGWPGCHMCLILINDACYYFLEYNMVVLFIECEVSILNSCIYQSRHSLPKPMRTVASTLQHLALLVVSFCPEWLLQKLKSRNLTLFVFGYIFLIIYLHELDMKELCLALTPVLLRKTLSFLQGQEHSGARW